MSLRTRSVRRWAMGLALAGVMLMPLAAQAQDVSGGGFYPFRGSARTIGLAGAYTAVSDDTAGMHFNPAGFAQVTARQASVSVKVNADGEDYFRLAYIEPVLEDKPFGLGLSYLTANDGAGRDDDVYQLTYGQFFLDEFAFGLNLRYHVVDAPGADDEDFAFDLGVLYQPRKLEDFTFGLAVLDVNEPSFGGIGNSKRVFNLGAAYRPDEQTVLALDFYDIGSNANRGGLRFGAERAVTRNIQLRAGLAEDTFAVGASLMYQNFTLDYGFQAVDDGPDINMLSFLASF